MAGGRERLWCEQPEQVGPLGHAGLAGFGVGRLGLVLACKAPLETRLYSHADATSLRKLVTTSRLVLPPGAGCSALIEIGSSRSACAKIVM
jgi:hypothetical protein